MKQFIFLTSLLLLFFLSVDVTRAQNANHNFDRWEKDITAFEQADKTQPPPTNGIEFIGSSTIQRWKTLEKDFPGVPVFNRGFGGSEIVDSTHFAARIIIPYAPRMVVLRCGGNDLWGGKTPEQVFADFKEFTATVHAQLPKTVVVYLSLSPSISRWKQHEKEKELNRLVKGFIDKTPATQYLESYDIALGPNGEARPELFVADQLHFNEEGYKLLIQRVKPLVEATR